MFCNLLFNTCYRVGVAFHASASGSVSLLFSFSSHDLKYIDKLPNVALSLILGEKL